MAENLSKEGNRYPGPGSKESPKQDEPKETQTQTCIFTKMEKVADKEQILKSSERKKKNFASQKGMAWYGLRRKAQHDQYNEQCCYVTQTC